MHRSICIPSGLSNMECFYKKTMSMVLRQDSASLLACESFASDKPNNTNCGLTDPSNELDETLEAHVLSPQRLVGFVTEQASTRWLCQCVG